jgi:methionyl-tRNA synthetase
VRLGEQAVAVYRRAMDAYALHDGAAAAFRLIDAVNEYLAATSPWAMARDPALADRLTQVLFDAAEAIRLAAVLLSPIMPRSSAEILRRVGAGTAPVQFSRDARWRADGERVLIQEGPLWPRKETSVTDNQTPGETAAPSTSSPAPVPVSKISIEDFMKVELRVAKVLAAERVPKSKKLLKLQVDVGSEQRQIVAGIAEAYEPDALVGRTVVIVFNLQPATLMGVESNGMVLAASPDGDKPVLLSFEHPPAPGTRVR